MRNHEKKLHKNRHTGLGPQVVVLEHGDALVMDSMATLHGVEGVLPPGDPRVKGGRDVAFEVGLPPGSRLGVLLWTAAPPPRSAGAEAEEGSSSFLSMAALRIFASDDGDDDDE